MDAYQIEAILSSFIEIELTSPDNFLIVKETLTRIGVASSRENTLSQSCHIFTKRGKLYICHFKELFKLDGKFSNFDESDKARRNAIAHALQDWNLIKIKNVEVCSSPICPLSTIKILSHEEKAGWQLVPKYEIGSRRNRH